MSATSQSTGVTDFEAVSPCPTRVFVNGVRLPAAGVDVHLRKEGPLAINRYAEVSFASPWNDKDFLSLFNRFSDSKQSDILRIEVRDQKVENYGTLFHGIVTGVGDSNGSNRKIHHCRGRGPEFFMENIPASKRFSNNAKVSDIFGYVVEELNNNSAITVKSGNISGTVEDVDSSDLTSFIEDIFDIEGAPNEPFFGVLDDLLSEKTFTANKHYLSDVIKWLQGKIQSRIWIQPTKNGGEFITTPNPVKNNPSHKAHYLDGGKTRVIDNNALAEIKPLNTIIVKGGVRTTYENPGAYSVQARGVDEKFTKTKARHTELYERANGKELSDTVVKTDATTQKEVENEAKSILKRKIDQATGGSMSVVHDRFIQPFDTITAKPTVNSETKQTIDPITYEVSRCHYKVRPNEPMIPQIKLNCGIKCDMKDDIQIVRSWQKDA